MSKAQYDIYRRKVFDLSRTLVVKSSASADAINRELRNYGFDVNENDPSTWKYYLHLAGNYHSSDQAMTVKSLDTTQDIAFTRATLNDHLATLREYRTFGAYYRALVARYPDQEDLIRGILNPVAFEDAVDTVDGSILYFDSELVEPNEENLIPRLEAWCQVFSRRWLVRAYAQVDDLYVAAHLAQLYMLIPSVVMNIRLGNCHTNYAHSYHIREYLASHQKLDWAVDYMTKKQMLWLYRQIRFIERNAGKQSTFHSLIQNILTERSLPLAEWSMRHQLKEMPGELVPRIEFARDTLNLDLSAAGVETRTVTEMLDAEEIVAKGNSRVLEDAAVVIREQMENSPDDRLDTKILESAVLDTSDATIFTFADTLLNHWLYLSFVGRYTAVITVDNPKTGAPLVLSVRDAFIVFVYSFSKAYGLEIHNLPVLPAHFVRKLQMPLRSEIEGLIDRKLLNPAVVDALFRPVTPVGNYISTQAFYTDVKRIHQGLLDHRWIWATREHKDERGQVEGAALHFYQHVDCDLGSTQSFDDWFTERGLDMPSFSELEAGLLADVLVSYATGANLNTTTSLKDIQAAMLKIMSTLSSYSVQYLQSINTQPLIVTDWPMPRIGDIFGSGGDQIEGISLNWDVLSVAAQARITDDIQDKMFSDDMDVRVRGTSTDRVEWNLDTRVHGQITYRYRVELPEITVLNDNFPLSGLDSVVDTDSPSYTPEGSTPLAEAFSTLSSVHYGLSAEDRTTLVDRWAVRPQDTPYDLYLEGLSYPPIWPDEVVLGIFTLPVNPSETPPLLDQFTYPSGP